jgi:hypothetical protein
MFADARWKVGVRQLVLPSSTYFRQRVPTDVVVLKSPMVTSVANMVATLAVAPVVGGAIVHTTIHSPPILALFDFNLKILHDFSFSMNSAMNEPIQFRLNSPNWYLSLIFTSDL